jgi:hypothetical protein
MQAGPSPMARGWELRRPAADMRLGISWNLIWHPVIPLLLIPALNRNLLRPAHGGVFAQHTHSASYYIVYRGNTPENHPPAEACIIHSKQHRGVQNSGPWDPWLPVVKTSRLFAQRAHSARCAPDGSGMTAWSVWSVWSQMRCRTQVAVCSVVMRP